MQRFTDLKVWQRSQALAVEVYRLTADLPKDKRFGLTSQVRRAAASVATNIAEGSKRLTKADYARFLNIAEGSSSETESLLLLARDLNFVEAEELSRCFQEISGIARMLHALRTKVAPLPPR